MTKGVIVRKNEKGFGFIKPEDESKDVFFHANDCVDANFDELNEGDTVEFTLQDSDKGPKAAEVKAA